MTGLLTPDDVRAKVTRRLKTSWPVDVLTGGGWPRTIKVDSLGQAERQQQWATVAATAAELRAAADRWGVGPLPTKNRNVHGTTQAIPTAVQVPTLETAARIAGGDWPARITAARHRVRALNLDPTDPASPRILRQTDGWSDVDVELLRTSADWFRHNGPGTGLTPRQVPIPGLHAKWLDTRQRVVADLAGLERLDLTQRPSTIEMTYLDPDYLQTDARVHDSITLGDHHTAPYPITVAVICENKDSRLFMHPHPGAVAIQGHGTAVGRIAHIPWIDDVKHLYYWGDIDTDGFQILATARACFARPGRPLQSLLMDERTRAEYEMFGTNTHPDGRPITRKSPHSMPDGLTPDEQGVYLELTRPDNTTYVRYEQERIPLDVVAAALTRALHERPAP